MVKASLCKEAFTFASTKYFIVVCLGMHVASKKVSLHDPSNSTNVLRDPWLLKDHSPPLKIVTSFFRECEED